jgi:hypothetical protein
LHQVGVEGAAAAHDQAAHTFGMSLQVVGAGAGGEFSQCGLDIGWGQRRAGGRCVCCEP